MKDMQQRTINPDTYKEPEPTNQDLVKQIAFALEEFTRLKPIVLATLLLFITPAVADHATWYGNQFHGRLTASGERFNQNAMTCASNKHKLGTQLKVTNTANGKSVVCHVNDTGKLGKGVVVDLSKGAFAKIAPLSQGRVKVKVTAK